MKPLVASLTLAVICLAGAVGYLVWDRQASDDSASVGATTTPALDAPRYTHEEVIAKIMNYGFDMQSNGETEHLTVTDSVFRTVCGGSVEPFATTLLDSGLFLGAVQEGARHCQSETYAIHEGNGRWTVSITFKATQPKTARFSFREDTGEVIALNGMARNLVGH